MKKFDSNVVVVTGESCDIGRATTLAFAQKGAKVVITSRRIKETCFESPEWGIGNGE